MVDFNDRYMRNSNLPKAGAKKQFSIETMAELDKCERDPIYFATKYFKIVHVDRGLIPFELYDYQREAIEIFQTHNSMIMCASRQCGKTSFATVILLHTALFNDNKLIAILANKGATAREILKRVKTAYEWLPDWLKGGIKEWNKGSIEFENGSVIMAEASSSDNIRGKTVFLLYIDEHAFVENWEEFSASVLPTLSSGETTKMIFTSTPNGLNHFYYYVEAARNGTNGFGLVEVPWYRVPGRDDAWKEKAIKALNNNLLKFDQEYNLMFIGSSGTLIAGSALQLMIPTNPLNLDQHISLYEERKTDRQYVMTVDTSRGKGLDYSAFQLVDVTTVPYKVVVTYRNNLITPTDFSTIVHRFATFYNNAYVLVELNDLGQQVADLLWEVESNLICTKSNGRAGRQVSYGNDSERGLKTTSTSKSIGCMMLKLLIEQNKLVTTDRYTIEELNVFSAKGKSWEAEPGKHDDMVMCLVFFAWLCSVGFIDQVNNQSIQQHLKERTDEDYNTYLLPFGVVVNGTESDVDKGWSLVDDNWGVMTNFF